ncbi:MAG: PEP-CTERM sorting domain-containing protein [Pirellulaceae bacterium]|nr:PEP-CTERM sorting domain-containing protein [Pirellulaceae bacterium]
MATTEGANPDQRTKNIRLWLNGVDRTEDMLPGRDYGYGVNTDLAKIGGRFHNETHPTTHSGAQDEVSLWLDRALSDEEIGSLYEAAISAGPIAVPGDFDGDGQLTALDIDRLSDAALAGDNKSQFDLNGDSLVNQSDREVWVDELKFTYFGDSNLDGEFNSTDFVVVFAEDKYEDGVDGNSGWGSGDWNGDKDFDSSDFVAAFGAGGYEMGARQVAAVPEPSTFLLFAIGLLICLVRRR